MSYCVVCDVSVELLFVVLSLEMHLKAYVFVMFCLFLNSWSRSYFFLIFCRMTVSLCRCLYISLCVCLYVLLCVLFLLLWYAFSVIFLQKTFMALSFDESISGNKIHHRHSLELPQKHPTVSAWCIIKSLKESFEIKKMQIWYFYRLVDQHFHHFASRCSAGWHTYGHPEGENKTSVRMTNK